MIVYLSARIFKQLSNSIEQLTLNEERNNSHNKPKIQLLLILSLIFIHLIIQILIVSIVVMSLKMKKKG